jgi:hypothetical protein
MRWDGPYGAGLRKVGEKKHMEMSSPGKKKTHGNELSPGILQWN